MSNFLHPEKNRVAVAVDHLRWKIVVVSSLVPHRFGFVGSAISLYSQILPKLQLHWGKSFKSISSSEYVSIAVKMYYKRFVQCNHSSTKRNQINFRTLSERVGKIVSKINC